MKRKTKFQVYVDKAIMDKPNDLADAVMAHLIKRDVDTAIRKRFLAQFMAAPTDKHKLKVVDEWVLMKDVAMFPFRKEEPEQVIERGADEDTGIERGISVDGGESDNGQEAGTASDGCDTCDGQGDEGDTGDIDG